MDASEEELREILAQAYTETKGVPFGKYVSQRHLHHDGEEQPIMLAMKRAHALGARQSAEKAPLPPA